MPKLCFIAKFAFFSFFVFSTTFYVLQKWSCNFNSNCQNTLRTFISCSLRFVTLEKAIKVGQSLFFTGKIAFFSQILCFQRPRRCYRKDLVSSVVTVKLPFRFLLIVPCGLSHSIMPGKQGPNLFFTGKNAFFFKNLCFQQLLRCNRIDPVTSTVIVRIPRGRS